MFQVAPGAIGDRWSHPGCPDGKTHFGRRMARLSSNHPLRDCIRSTTKETGALYLLSPFVEGPVSVDQQNGIC